MAKHVKYIATNTSDTSEPTTSVNALCTSAHFVTAITFLLTTV